MAELMEQKTETDEVKPIITIKNLNFWYDKKENNGVPNIVNLNCVLQPKSRVILVGANGAGKSTLMRILTGQIFMGIDHEGFDVNGTSTPADQFNGVAFLGGAWKRRRTGFDGICPYTMDILARDMMKKWQDENLERRDELVRVLGINLDWKMHECSDGQRKKVRIMIKLLRPFQLCIIDEFAADLDIFSRSRFFDYLAVECDKRGASVIYATHIFDNADSWATHAMFMQLDKTLSPVHCLETYEPYLEILARTGKNRAMCPMYTLVLEELERQYRCNSALFQGDIDNKCLMEAVMEQQAKEIGGEAHEVARAGDQSGWVSGRLARAEGTLERKRRMEENKEVHMAEAMANASN